MTRPALPSFRLPCFAVGLASLLIVQLAPTVAAAPQAPTDPVAEFSRLEVEGALDIVLVQGTAPMVRVDTAGDPAAQVRIQVRGDTLVVRSVSRPTGWFDWLNRGQRQAPRVTITFTRLTDVDVSGASTLSATRIDTPRLAFDVSGAASVTITDLATGELSIDGSGAMKADIAGRATIQRVQISGAGDYKAARLVSEQAEIEVSGAGKVLVNASKSLRISLSGAGLVDYIGNPVLQKSVSGLGRVRQVHATADGVPVGMLRPPASGRQAGDAAVS